MGYRNKSASFAINLNEMIKDGEGYRANSYLDTEGIKTIGYGFNMEVRETCEVLDSVNPHIRDEDIIDEEEARQVLYILAEKCIDEIDEILESKEIDLSEREAWQVVLCDMVYNLGKSRLLKFVRMWRAIKDKDYELAIAEIENSRYYKQTGRRAKRNIKFLLNNKIDLTTI